MVVSDNYILLFTCLECKNKEFVRYKDSMNWTCNHCFMLKRLNNGS